MKIEHAQVFGFEAALRGMRNPLDSWDKSDSNKFRIELGDDLEIYYRNYVNTKNYNPEYFILGQEDMKLSQKLTKAGSEHCKHLRMIGVWVDLTLPRFIWSEFDTYHYNTKNSCSTMHTIHKRPLTQEDFEYPIETTTLDALNYLIYIKEDLGTDFISKIKNALPDGFLQKRTVFTNYAELYNMHHQRKNHRLNQWHEISDWILSLPYFKELTGIEI